MRLNKWKYLFKTYFNYTVKEQRAIIVLMFLVFFLQATLIAMHFIPINGISRNDMVANDTIETDVGVKNFSIAKSDKQKFQKANPQMFSFNPNTIGIKDWVRLGLTEKQSETILKYISKGGYFKAKNDLGKMRVIKPALLQLWWNYILLPDSFSDVKKYSVTSKSIGKQLAKMNINQATIEELDQLPLIGEGRARAILAYREKLGGYISVDQLLEIKCIPDSVYRIIETKVITDGKIINPLNINADSLFHPYLPKSLAKMIVTYRQQHKNYQRIEDLSVLPLYDDKIMRKIAPYLIVKP
jgi:competence ComEA-like helix-hairpin-helix protein